MRWEPVIDATLIESTARPKKTITLEMDAEGKAVQFEDGSQPGISCTEEHSADPDSRAQSCIACTRTNHFRHAEAGKSIDQQKALYCRAVFRHNQTLIQNRSITLPLSTQSSS
ncbi:MAG: hypothetical protein KBA82_00555 [Nitrosomonas sp.]|nr:hypothetical protein [Nitrosomonas sp.]MBP7111487.1 hypothetical protein [Nitrosomonas sp.]